VSLLNRMHDCYESWWTRIWKTLGRPGTLDSSVHGESSLIVLQGPTLSPKRASAKSSMWSKVTSDNSPLYPESGKLSKLVELDPPKFQELSF